MEDVNGTLSEKVGTTLSRLAIPLMDLDGTVGDSRRSMMSRHQYIQKFLTSAYEDQQQKEEQQQQLLPCSIKELCAAADWLISLADASVRNKLRENNQKCEDADVMTILQNQVNLREIDDCITSVMQEYGTLEDCLEACIMLDTH